ncbi:toxin glutamine deamidase domain-containing protein [Mycobacterium sp. SMC-18]|uniref:putative alpha/beta hydrolase n=1 Tax=Mycobacterium sp. SMC-18 TaxID=3381629 RepID=UPI00387601E3
MGEFKHFTRDELAGAAGIDPWLIDKSLQAGDPAKIDAIADGVHRAGMAAGEVDGDFESARKQFRDAWVSDGAHSPINESAEVRRITTSVGAHRDQLKVIGAKYEQIAAALAKAQRAADTDIAALEKQLHAIDEQMDAAESRAATDPTGAQNTLEAAKALAIQFVQTAGDEIKGLRSTYAAVLAEAETVLKANGSPLAPEVPDIPLVDPAAQQATDELKRLTDQAVIDQMAKVRAIQKALDRAAADAYVHGPGTPEGDAALAKTRQLRTELASALDDLGNIPDYSKLDPKAVAAGADGHLLGDYTVDGLPAQLYGQLKNGSGQIFDQARQTSYTFKDGKLVGMSRLDQGRVTPDDELLFNAVTAAVGAPEAAAGVKAAGELGVQGLKRLLSKEGFDVTAAPIAASDVLPHAMTAAEAQAAMAEERLRPGGLHGVFDAYPAGTPTEPPSITDIGHWLPEINHGPGMDPFDPARAVNCGQCALAVEQRLSGAVPDASAGLGTLSVAEMEAATGLKQVPATPAQIEQYLIDQGAGAHTVVGVDRAGGVAGHWFNAYYDGKNVYAIDGQTGQVLGWPPNMDFPGYPVTNWDMGVRK